MKKLLMVATMAMASALFAQDKTMSSADARGKIGDIISNPVSMTSVMKQLAAADQASFLADVNAAIAIEVDVIVLPSPGWVEMTRRQCVKAS